VRTITEDVLLKGIKERNQLAEKLRYMEMNAITVKTIFQDIQKGV